MTNGPVTK